MAIHNIKTRHELEEFLKKNEVVIVYCSLSHCVPCKMVYPKFEKLVDEYVNISFCKIIMDELEDDDCDTYIKEKLNLTKYPSFTLINNGNILDNTIGPNINKVISILECIGDTGNEDF
tara:strand:+ start:2699 stop:3052 length:354 start_codon:yes stop_codon:yes gene_type:complete